MENLKGCGCRADGLTRGFALWACACGAVQRVPRGKVRDCLACKRQMPAYDRGAGCCYRDVLAGSACSGCGKVAADVARLPHREVEYLTEDVARGSFRARDSFVRCVGCQALVAGTD